MLKFAFLFIIFVIHTSQSSNFILVRINNANNANNMGLKNSNKQMKNEAEGNKEIVNKLLTLDIVSDCKLKPVEKDGDIVYPMGDMLLTKEQCEEFFAPKQRAGIPTEE